nr:rhomboid family intramembrane serine protease [Pseudenhygromyxa sp. WMMC2535]
MLRWGALAPARIWLDGDWWRLLTAGLLHGSWLHLALNMSGLWVVGQWVERAWGPWRMLLLFTLSSVGGCLASLAWAEAPLVVGASAGIFGIAGALVVGRAWGREAIQDALEPISAARLAGWLAFWLVLGFGLPLLGVSVLAQAGHLGGLAVGAALGWASSRPEKQRLFGYGAWGLTVCALSAAAFHGATPRARFNDDLFIALDLLERGRGDEAVPHLESLLDREPDDPSLANDVAYFLALEGVELTWAEELVGVAIADDPENANYLDTLGWIQCRLGLGEVGLETLGEARELGAGIEEVGEHIMLCGVVGD